MTLHNVPRFDLSAVNRSLSERGRVHAIAPADVGRATLARAHGDIESATEPRRARRRVRAAALTAAVLIGAAFTAQAARARRRSVWQRVARALG